MTKFTLILLAIVIVISSCRSTRKIQTVVAPKPKDTTAVVVVPKDDSHDDSLHFINDIYTGIQKNHISFTTFSAKIDVDYQDATGKKDNVNAHIRMYKDSVIWISITGLFGFEGLRAYITPDSVKIIDKLNKTYTSRSVSYLQEVTALPLDLTSLEDLLLGNPVFLDSNIVSYTKLDNSVSLLSIGDFFKNLFTIDGASKQIQSSKLDDLDELRNRTCFLTYGGYENKKGVNFATRRHITVTEKKKLDIDMNYKQYDFNETLSFPFSVPKNYKTN